MVLKPSSSNELIALLSVASGVGASASENAISPEFGGRSLVEWQIHALADCGVRLFLIEVDNVGGPLLTLVDNLRETGLRIEFVRHARDLTNYLSHGAGLIVQAEAHYFAPAVLETLIVHEKPFLAILDGRDENSNFERIDLNTRWAGLGIIDPSDLATLSDLPEEWSLTSLLLRHAIQTGTRFIPIEQAYIQNGDLAVVANQADVDTLTRQLLITRRAAVSGVIEKHVFAPIAALLAPSIWRSPAALSVLAGSSLALASIGLACALFGWGSGALAIAFAALFAHSIDRIVTGTKIERRFSSLRQYSLWGLIVSTQFFVASPNYGISLDNWGPLATLFGLCLLAHKMILPRWVEPFLLSPALLIAVLLSAKMLNAFFLGAQIIVLAQIALLLAGHYLSSGAPENSK